PTSPFIATARGICNEAAMDSLLFRSASHPTFQLRPTTTATERRTPPFLETAHGTCSKAQPEYRSNNSDWQATSRCPRLTRNKETIMRNTTPRKYQGLMTLRIILLATVLLTAAMIVN